MSKEAECRGQEKRKQLDSLQNMKRAEQCLYADSQVLEDIKLSDLVARH